MPILLLFVLFLVLKLVGVIAWSWLWVTAPLWIGVILAVLGSIFVGTVAGLIALVTKPWK